MLIQMLEGWYARFKGKHDLYDYFDRVLQVYLHLASSKGGCSKISFEVG